GQLLDAAADANDSRCGFTALHAMTWVRQPIRGDGDPPPIGSGTLTSLDLVRALVAKGADVNARYGEFKPAVGRLNYRGATPFLMAAESADVPLLRLLLELGADPMLGNVDNCTPLLAAAGVGVLSDGDESAGTQEEAIAAVELLLELGCDVNAIDDNGNSVMHGAAYKSWSKLIRLLTEQGADKSAWNRKNKLGWTPLLIAEGHRPGNFRPSPDTVAAVEQALLKQ
ncbi:MAG: ankyrin repeat domain-containing protein, partial [Aureliella sp.]